jgi:hypothetical protein
MSIKTYAFLDANNYVVNTAIFEDTVASEVIQKICEHNKGVKFQSFDEFGNCSLGDLWLGYAYQPPRPGENYEWVEGENVWYWREITS